MLYQVCVRVLLVTLGLHCACVGAGVLRRSAELATSTGTAFRATTQPSSSSLPTQESGSGAESGSGQGGQQPEQPESTSGKEAPTASEGRPEYKCPRPWSGNTWTGNTMKSFDVVNVLSTRNVCREVQVEEEQCSFQWSSKCLTDISSCISCHTVVTGKRTECKEEEIELQELRQTDRRQMNSNPGYINPVPRGQVNYLPSKEVVWQLQAMEGHRVYLQLSHIDLRNKDGKCSDYIEISFNPCTPPTKICDNRVRSYTWATSQTKVQVRFVSDHSNPTNGIGFRGAYYYYPVNTSNPLEDALNVLRQTNASATSSSRRKRREVLKQLYVNGMLTETRADSSAQVSRQTRSQNVETLPLTNQRLFCISDILQSGKATKYIRDVQCQQLATVFHKEGFYSP